jgi:5-methylcytosine-specific restriction endonuclease McrA
VTRPYNDKRWERKREAILKRDKYRCRNCSRYGKTKEANTVHHVKPVEYNPELYLDSKNLISLCSVCHNKMHDRVTDELTNLGREWVSSVWGDI